MIARVLVGPFVLARSNPTQSGFEFQDGQRHLNQPFSEFCVGKPVSETYRTSEGMNFAHAAESASFPTDRRSGACGCTVPDWTWGFPRHFECMDGDLTGR